ncbi:MAG: hypothetical protein WC516_05680 [Patescibacteria group bacterium]
MLRLVQVGNSLPFSYPVDISSTFQPGCIGQLKLIGNNIVLGLSDGTAPLGIIDDVRTNAFTQPVVDEIVIISANGIDTDGYYYYTHADTKQELRNANLMRTSFVADYDGLILNPVNGILTLPAGSKLNWDSDGDHKVDSVRTITNYVYQVPSIPGDDTTIGSNRVTIWFQRGIFATDQFDTLQKYPLSATLFVNEEGKLSTKQCTPTHPGVAIVTGPPSSMVNSLEFLWL